MKKIDLGQAIGILANLGVVVGILFLVVETQQNTDAIRSATAQDVSRWSYDSTIAIIENDSLREALAGTCTGAELSLDQWFQVDLYYAALLRLNANRFYQAQLGVMSEESLLDLGSRGNAYRSPVFAEVWPNRRDEFGPEFQGYVERELLPLVEDTCPGFSGR